MVGVGNILAFEGLAYALLYVAQFAALARMDYGNRYAGLSGASGTPRAVGVCGQHHLGSP